MMRWFRSNMRWGVGCALFALALQFMLTFTHVHADGIGPLSAAALSTRLAAQVPAALPDAPAVPANPHPEGGADDFCAICALIHVADSLITRRIAFAATAGHPQPPTAGCRH